MTKLSTLMSVIGLILLAPVLSARAQEEPVIDVQSPDLENRKFVFNYGEETLSIPMVPLGKDGKPVPEYVEFFNSITHEEALKLAKIRELKLQFYTFLVSKIKFEKLAHGAEYAQDAWMGPVEVPVPRYGRVAVPNVGRWWDRKYQSLIETALAAIDRHFWNNLLARRDKRNTASSGLIAGFGVGAGTGPFRGLGFLALGFGLSDRVEADGRPRFMVIGQFIRHAPGSVMSGLLHFGPYYRGFRNYDRLAVWGAKTHMTGYFLGTPLSFGRMRTAQDSPINETASASFEVGYPDNWILNPLKTAVFASAGTGRWGTAAVLTSAYYLLSTLSSVNGAIVDIYSMNLASIPVPHSVLRLYDYGAGKVEPITGLVSTGASGLRDWVRGMGRHFLHGTLLSNKKMCAGMLLFR